MSTNQNEIEQSGGATTELATGDPSGVSLKAAWLLLRGLRRYPALPKVEELATLLDGVLNYEWAIRLLRIAADEYEMGGLDLGGSEENIVQFANWVDQTLLR